MGLGRRLTLDARWGELTVFDEGGEICLRAAASPLAVDMGSVAAAEIVVEDLGARRLAAGAAAEALGAVERRPSVGLLRFATMAGLGAAALSVIFGATDLPTVALVAASAGAGACLRRAVSHASDNPFLQPFVAALLAGAVTAGALRLRVPIAPSLVAVCPCMVLVPGPHFLNGLLDLARARIPLGGARLFFAVLVVAAICAGLLIGLSPATTGGLPDGGATPTVPLLRDVLAAGLAVAAYASFFDMPWRTLPAPIVVGMLAHALRWELLARGGSVETGALVACLLVGMVMTPVAHRLRMPFAGLAFASVVSLIPGVFMFRTAADAVTLVNASATASLDTVVGLLGSASTALVILLAMGQASSCRRCCSTAHPPSAEGEPAQTKCRSASVTAKSKASLGLIALQSSRSAQSPFESPLRLIPICPVLSIDSGLAGRRGGTDVDRGASGAARGRPEEQDGRTRPIRPPPCRNRRGGSPASIERVRTGRGGFAVVRPRGYLGR